mgnify:CR=1 FL=1
MLTQTFVSAVFGVDVQQTDLHKEGAAFSVAIAEAIEYHSLDSEGWLG